MREAVTILFAHPRSEFPPHWEPPPRRFSFGGGPEHDQLLALAEALAETDSARWVREVYLQKLRGQMRTLYLDGNRQRRLAALLTRLPEVEALVSEFHKARTPREKTLLASMRGIEKGKADEGAKR
jgi:hypothetical protein